MDEEVEDAGVASGSGSGDASAGKKPRQSIGGIQDKSTISAIYANCLNLFETKVPSVLFVFLLSSKNESYYFVGTYYVLVLLLQKCSLLLLFLF